ncbi:hypothetical protein BJV77DRAFT_951102, partial [Russula vinacea]
LKGSVNDTTTFLRSIKPNGSHHGRSSVCSPRPLSATAFVTSVLSAPLLDGLLGISLIVHSHIGVLRKFPTLSRLPTWTLRLTSLAVGVDLYKFNTNGIGACFVNLVLAPN